MVLRFALHHSFFDHAFQFPLQLTCSLYSPTVHKPLVRAAFKIWYILLMSTTRTKPIKTFRITNLFPERAASDGKAELHFLLDTNRQTFGKCKGISPEASPFVQIDIKCPNGSLSQLAILSVLRMRQPSCFVIWMNTDKAVICSEILKRLCFETIAIGFTSRAIQAVFILLFHSSAREIQAENLALR
ncbi:hypothetical protein J6590_059032 [Homalodisca vitripennis]|nr:hypothetical protein J6590_059032 [Homalodisca vitripennis]